MNICIDGFSLYGLPSTGVKTYCFELLNHLFKIYPQPKYHILWDESSDIPHFISDPNVHYEPLLINRKENDYTCIEDYIKKNHIHIFHCPDNGFSIPYNKYCNYIMTIHDLMAFTEKNEVDAKYFNKFTSVFPQALSKCDHVIVTSKCIEKDLIENFHVSEDKIHTVYPGISEIFHPIFPSISEKFLWDHYKIHHPYFLFVGSIHPRKNFESLLRAFQHIFKLFKNHHFIIIGSTSGKRKKYTLEIQDFAKKLSIDDHVHFLGEIPYKHLPMFYNGALCTINLSNYEGFPFSTLEAMACNCPTLCSDHAVFKEITKNASLLVSPNDITHIVHALKKLACSGSFRNNLISQGFNQSLKFNWTHHIYSLIKLYESFI